MARGDAVAPVRKRTVLIVAAVALSICLFALGYHQLWLLDHHELAAVLSPSGRFIALSYSAGEGARTPYGSEVMVYRRSLPWARYFARPVFGGYCRDVTLTWVTDDSLIISCPGAREAWSRDRCKGVHISIQ